MADSRTPLHIGIVACSTEGAALCYRTECAEAFASLGAYERPEMPLHTPSFALCEMPGRRISVGCGRAHAGIGAQARARRGDLSGYGLVNAVTHFSQDVEDYDRATEFEALGGKLIELAPAEWKGLGQVA